ncbi:Pycsar system effector family protein [Streptomyces acidicola]|uniref:Integral membrane plasmid transfer protein n=1 Tax=Streptomyces acidicola TaxID=2596892 RepID=A0A5N8WNA5_9ACTN|nr:Pycsar system effector family protein [Streptomyces acidicola]MPY48921.1 integral membrane plasmid transfer protein [Streptomyces acidicola]
MSATTENLKAMHAEVKAETARTDTKTGLLLAFVGAVLAGSWTVARDLPMTPAACVVGGLGMAVLVAAADLLLRSTQPNLRGRHGFPLWATLTPEQITAIAAGRDLPADIAGLSRLTVGKFTNQRRAITLTRAGGALLILALLLTLGGVL